MKKVLIISSLILVGSLMVSCTSENSSEISTSDYLVLWTQAYDRMRDPTPEELELAPEITVTPGRFEYSNEDFVTSFDLMEEGSFNGFTSTSEDPDSRGYAFIIYYDGELYDSFGVGIGMSSYLGYAKNIEEANNVITVDIYINYTVTDISTSNVNDIVTIHVTTFTFQHALITEVN